MVICCCCCCYAWVVFLACIARRSLLSCLAVGMVENIYGLLFNLDYCRVSSMLVF